MKGTCPVMNAETPQSDADAPDVKSIVEEVRSSADKAAEAGEALSNAESSTSLKQDLEVLNRTYSGADRSEGGVGWIFRKALFRLLGLRSFNERVAHVLNKIVAMLEGTATAESDTILAQQRRKIDELTQLSRRLARYDDMNIEERLTHLEARADATSAEDPK